MSKEQEQDHNSSYKTTETQSRKTPVQQNKQKTQPKQNDSYMHNPAQNQEGRARLNTPTNNLN